MTGTVVPTSSAPTEEPPARRRLRVVRGTGDILFRSGVRSAGFAVLAITGTVAIFLIFRAFNALKVAKFKFLTTQAWQPDVHRFGMAAILTGTLVIALIAVIISTPLAIGT